MTVLARQNLNLGQDTRTGTVTGLRDRRPALHPRLLSSISVWGGHDLTTFLDHIKGAAVPNKAGPADEMKIAFRLFWRDI